MGLTRFRDAILLPPAAFRVGSGDKESSQGFGSSDLWCGD